MNTDGTTGNGIAGGYGSAVGRVAIINDRGERWNFSPANDGAADLAPGTAPLVDHHLIEDPALDGEAGEVILCEVFSALVDLLHHIRAGDFDLEAPCGPFPPGSGSNGSNPNQSAPNGSAR